MTLKNPFGERRLDYLRKLANREWPTPSGFGGAICYRALPLLALQATGEVTGGEAWAPVEYSLQLLRDRKDCQDFAMSGFVRMLYRYGDSPVLTSDQWNEMKAVHLGAKYQPEDPGGDSCCWTSENHIALYASAEYLLGQLWPEEIFQNTGKRGAWHRERARERLFLWLDWRHRLSFNEWNSACYYIEDLAALLNLCDFAEDDAIRKKARAVTDALFFHLAVNMWRGLSTHTMGRAYEREMFLPDATGAATLAALAWGEDTPPEAFCLGAISLAASDYDVPEAIAEAGRDRPDERTCRERHGVRAEEASEYGIHPDRLRDLNYFHGSGLGHHPLVAETRYAASGGDAKHDMDFYDVHYYRKLRETGEEPDPLALPHATAGANLYTFQTPAYSLSCAQAFRPGTPGYQQFIWCAAVGGRAVVFTTNPAPPDVPYGRPGPWVGNGILPKAVQHRNVLVCLHRVHPYPIYDMPPWHREDRVHAYFPHALFDEVREANGWCFGRKGDGYVALRPDRPAQWRGPDANARERIGSDAPCEWNVDATDVAWICEMGSAAQWDSFNAFVDAVSSASVDGGVDRIVYESPSIGTVETGWDLPLAVKGTSLPLEEYPRFDNPYCQAPFGADGFEIICGEHTHRVEG